MKFEYCSYVTICFLKCFFMLLSSSVMSDSLRPHGLQHPRLPCPLTTPRVCYNSCASSQWYHPTISSSVIPFFSWLQSFPASGSFLMSQLFVLGGQSTGISALTSVLSMNIQGSFLLELTGELLVVLATHKNLLQHDSSKAWILQCSASFMFQLSQPYMTTGKTIALTRRTFVGKVMSLLLNMLSRLVIASLPRSKCLLISWLQSLATVILEPKKVKSVTVSNVSPSICHEVMGLDAMVLVFWMLGFKPVLFILSFFTFKRLFSSFLLSTLRVLSCTYLRLLVLSPQSWFHPLLHPAQHFSWCTLNIS